MPNPPGWCWIELQQVARLESGHTPSRKYASYWDGGIPWIGIKDARNHHGRRIFETLQTVSQEGLANSAARLLPAGTVCLSRTASVGYVLVMGDSMATSQDFVNWVCSEVVEPEFLMHLLITEKQSLLRFGKGTTHTTIYYPEVKAFHVCLPPKREQRAIVDAIESYLTRLDDAVATLERVQRNLKRYRASVLKAAVEGRLVPTEAELARAEDRDYEPASVLLERILAERRHRWEEAELAKMKTKGKPPKNDKWKAKYNEPVEPVATELSDLPVGWCWATVDQLTSRVTSGSRDWKQYYDRGDSVFLMAQNVRPGLLDLSFKQAIDPPPEDSSCGRSQVLLDDLLVTIVGANTGDVCRVPIELPKHFVCQSVALMRPVEGHTSKFLSAFLNSPPGQRVYEEFMYGQGRPHLSFDNLKETPVPMPPLSEQSRIVESAELSQTVVESLAAQVMEDAHRCRSLRQSILKWAFEGKLVDRHPSDEPAMALLERIKTVREDTPNKKPKGRGRRRARSTKA